MPACGDDTMPSAARMLDYLLGDGRNLAADRRLADVLRRTVPDIELVAQLGRAFMRRAVTHLVDAGLRQFLDLSAGTTSVGNVHEVAQTIEPSCRVVYVHGDPVSVVHTGQLIADAERVAVVQADIRDPTTIMTACGDGELLDVTAPIGLLMVAGLELLPPDSTNLVNIMAGYRDRVVPGSYLVISHLTSDQRPAQMAAVVQVMNFSLDPVHPRTREEVVSLFTGFELVAPGVVDAGDWRPERQLSRAEKVAATQLHVGVGRKPGRL